MVELNNHNSGKGRVYTLGYRRRVAKDFVVEEDTVVAAAGTAGGGSAVDSLWKKSRPQSFPELLADYIAV